MILFDIARGLLITMFFSIIGGWNPSLQLLVTGVLASILPDFDLLIHIVCGRPMKKWAHLHRDISHYPLIILPICMTVCWYYFGLWFGIFIATCVLGNYVYDSGEIGWGVQWFWPLPIIGKYYIAYKSIDGKPAQVHFWTYEQQRSITNRLGKENWISDSSSWSNECLFIVVVSIITWLWYLIAS